MNEFWKSSSWISGLQWLFFIFTNTVVIPITVGAAFGLPQESIASILQLSFIVTGIACMVQALFGHKRALMEGQSGLWWGVILTLTSIAVAQDMPLAVLGGSLAIGVILSGVITIIIGLTGLGPVIAKLFKPAVMGVFMFLFGVKLIGIFLKGMLGIPFGNEAQSATIDLSVSLLSIIIAIIVIVISIKAPPAIRRYSLLIGIVIGWIAFNLTFGGQQTVEQTSSSGFSFFPLGEPVWNTGVIITAILAGLLNTANTFGALKGTDDMYQEETTNGQYRASFTITGIFTSISGVLGLVPYAPYVSSIGFLNQTGIIKRVPFIIGGLMFFVMGVIPPIGQFFSMLPLSIGSAVLFVSYLQLLNSSWSFFSGVTFTAFNVYRAAIPLFVGIIIMTLPPSYFETIPGTIRPLLSSGLLVGIMLALLLENMFKWDRDTEAK
ncbi:uracil/xanthine transporter [Lentibacillus amyloliquefaciens]|uniref:Uracil/xanthine transporter n=1 Tax=Lentibacillus amyloliquefaciens TaxID=1472767 RepID=A0A0U3W5N0_9BACI|nr:uracil/xanthine transporter [Lentibacillus amyloliquefaciens]ALX48482.1 uracil/xanthine transporter [Lentibacillus amyloliquefaciens]